jgi:hypothetical protein
MEEKIMGILSWISSLFTPVNKIIDTLDVSGNKKIELKNQFAEIQTSYSEKILEFEKARLEMIAKVQTAETQSSHWLTANWRPMVSIVLVAIALLSSFGVGQPDQNFWNLTEIFLGAYTGGRSLEKIASAVKIGKVQ